MITFNPSSLIYCSLQSVENGPLVMIIQNLYSRGRTEDIFFDVTHDNVEFLQYSRGTKLLGSANHLHLVNLVPHSMKGGCCLVVSNVVAIYAHNKGRYHHYHKTTPILKIRFHRREKTPDFVDTVSFQL